MSHAAKLSLLSKKEQLWMMYFEHKKGSGYKRYFKNKNKNDKILVIYFVDLCTKIISNLSNNVKSSACAFRSDLQES